MTRSILLSTTLIGLMALPAMAQDKAKFAASGATGIQLKVSGQINRAMLFADDGNNTETFFVDNGNSSSRFRFTGKGDLNEDTSVGFNWEVEMESNSSDDINQIVETTGTQNFKERKLELYFDSDSLGRLTLGQGSMAGDGAIETDLSGTSVISDSDVPALAGGILFNDKATNTLTGTAVGDVFNNYDQSRRDRLRYDTPDFNGFKLAGAVADNGRWDTGAFYEGEFGDMAVEAGASYANDNNDNNTYGGSISVLHKTSGFSLTGAIAAVDLNDNTDPRDPLFYYIKAGWQTKDLSAYGKTAFEVHYGYNEDTDVAGDESTNYGISVVQRLDAVGTELYLGVQNYEYDAPGTNYDDVLGVMAGARVKF